MKLFLKTSAGVMLLFCILLAVYLYRNLDIISAFAAKSACSCLFVAGRDETGASADLDFFPISLANLNVDVESQAVTADVKGHKPRKAAYRPGLGCALVHREGSPSPSFAIPTASPGPDSLPWPYGTNPPLPYSGPLDLKILEEAFAFAFLPESRTRTLLVVRNDQLVKEQYAPGFAPGTPQTGWSMTKCIAGSLVGILVQQQKMDLDAPLEIAAWQKDERRKITMNHLLRMASGLTWDENYFTPSDVNRMLFREPDAYSFSVAKKLNTEPGSIRKYSSGTSNIISGLLRQELGSDKNYWAFPYRELFHPIGMTTARLETDQAANYVLSSHCYATARDWAKFGLLYLHRGKWNGRQVVAESWVDYSITPDPNDANHGINFGLNTDHALYPDAPADLYFASGFNGQKVFVIPSENMVIVRLALTNFFDENRMLKDLVDSFR